MRLHPGFFLQIGAPNFHLGQGGEGRFVVGLNKLVEGEPLDLSGSDGEILGAVGLFKLQHLYATIGEGDSTLGPVGIVGEVCPEADAQPVDLYGSAEVQRHTGVGVPVDAPGCKGPGAVAVVAVAAVDGVLCFEHGFAAGLYIGIGVGVAAFNAVLVVYIQRQVAVVCQFKFLCGTGKEEVAQAGEGSLGIDGGSLAEGDFVNKILGQVAQTAPEDIVHLAVKMHGVLRGREDDLIAFLVFFQVAQFYPAVAAALSLDLAGGVDDLHC